MPADAARWLRGTTAMMAAETNATRPGGEAVVTRASDIVVIQVIRTWLGNDPGWRMQLAVDLLRDDRLSVAQVGHRLGYDWGPRSATPSSA